MTFSPIGIGADLLTGYFNARANVAAARLAPPQPSGASTGGIRDQVDITPPWDPASGEPQSEELQRRALATGTFLDRNSLGGFSDLEAPKDVQKLFALHQAVRALQAIATDAASDDVTGASRRSFDRRFQEGMTQIRDFIGQESFDKLTVATNETRSKAESTVPISRSETSFKTVAVHTGAYEDAVAGFASATPFTITSRNPSGVETQVSIDLSQMPPGDTRNMKNVTAFINTQLENAGLRTRFDDVKLTPDPDPNSDKPAPTPQYGFEVKGVGLEQLSFSAPPGQSSPALFVAGSSGELRSASSLLSEEARRGVVDTVRAGQITKISDLGAAGGPTVGASVRVEAAGEPGDADAESDFIITKTVSGGDGFYALAETAGTVDGVGPQGDKDVVLMKFDTTGRQVWSRALGATDSAEGLALAVGADGTIAVGGSLTGVYGDTIDVGEKDAFVASYDADGQQNWIKRFGTFRDDAIQSVAVADDGRVFVGGRTDGTLSGTTPQGGTDGFVRAFDTAGAVSWTQQIASSGTDTVSALAVDGGDLVVGSVRDGVGALEKYNLATGTQNTGFSVDLGGMDNGSIEAIAVDSANGAIYATGGARAGFTADSANAGARDAYILRADNTTGAVSYTQLLGTQAEDVATGLVVDDGDVFITGRTDGDLTTGQRLDNGDRQSFVARLNGADGAVEWTQQIQGRNGQSAAGGVAIVPNATNTLDVFGLPTGELQFEDVRTVADRTTAKAGDYFEMRIDGRKTRITLEAGDTLRQLAFDVDLALRGAGDANSTRIPGGNGLSIKPAAGVEIELLAGPEGRDLLTALGIEPGKIQNTGSITDEDGPEELELKLERDIKVSDRDSAQEALSALDSALSAIRRAYRNINKDPAVEAALEQQARLNGPVPEYLNSRIANYQAALSRLGGG